MTRTPLIALDIGGTKLAAGVVDPADGRILHGKTHPTDAAQGGLHVARRAAGLIAALHQAVPHAGTVAISLCEIIDAKGTIRSRSTVDWMGLDLPSTLQTSLPLHMVSDVRAAALAEARLGAARQCQHALYVSIGTGISSCLLIDGVPYAGAHGAALVLASAETRQHCDSCGSETRVSLERIASGAGLSASYARERGLSAETIIARATAGEAKAAALVNAATQSLGNAIGLLANALDPALIIAGGGLGRSQGLYWEQLSAAIRASLWADAPAQPAILQSTLGPNAAVLGAALAAAEGLH